MGSDETQDTIDLQAVDTRLSPEIKTFSYQYLYWLIPFLLWLPHLFLQDQKKQHDFNSCACDFCTWAQQTVHTTLPGGIV